MDKKENEVNEKELSASNDYSKYGIKDVPKFTKTTALGKTKTFAGLFPKEWLFVIVSIINITTAIGLTLYRMIVVVQSEDSDSPDFTFTLLLLINAVFCYFYVLHGVLRERVFELYAFMAAILVVTLYCLLEYFVFNPSRQTTVKLVRLILACLLAPPNIFLAFIVSKNFGYLEFRIVGASKELQRLYEQAAIFSCLLKFDLQATSSIVILALEDGTQVSTLETVSLAIGLPYSLMWCLLGWLTLRRELKYGAITFAVLGFIKPCYYVYKIVREYVKQQDPDVPTTDTIVYSIIAAVSIGLLVWAMLMIELWFVYKNFNKGLKSKVFTTRTATNDVNETSGLLRTSRS
ncbi:hypothetical protein BgiMline_010752 [Biomphalaria glabrata]|uniref:Uncharacterized protein LOC106061286 n=1 Tax=Biomphalaria glabrata TaxID=6526 RepID=A0A9U8E7B7_BIOGL|nr:uncharacterized protein LOC106061286 [Biomphalaria glabrata]KAI8739911.1 CAunnamed protein product [Biomphalaria glabrata]